MRIVEPSYKILSYPADLKKIEFAGRVCYNSHHRTTENSSETFVKNLINRGHFSVLEHESITVVFTLDRATADQLRTHRLTSPLMQSTRYVNFSKGEFQGDIPFIEPRLKNKNRWAQMMMMCEEAYLYSLEDGDPPEVARYYLPPCVATEMIVTANIREWRHILSVRKAADAQKEIRDIITKLFNELKSLIPIVFDDL